MFGLRYYEEVLGSLLDLDAVFSFQAVTNKVTVEVDKSQNEVTSSGFSIALLTPLHLT